MTCPCKREQCLLQSCLLHAKLGKQYAKKVPAAVQGDQFSCFGASIGKMQRSPQCDPVSRKHTYRNINRLRHILIVFTKHEFYRFIEDMHLMSLIPIVNRFVKRDAKVVDTAIIPRRLRIAFEELGPAFVKLGQMLSTRPDLVPEDFVNEFKKLQDEAPLFGVDTVKGIIEEELEFMSRARENRVVSEIHCGPSAGGVGRHAPQCGRRRRRGA